MQIRIVRDAISKDEVTAIAHAQFGDLVKAVVDVDLEIMALGGELHADKKRRFLSKAHDSRICGASISIRVKLPMSGSNSIR